MACPRINDEGTYKLFAELELANGDSTSVTVLVEVQSYKGGDWAAVSAAIDYAESILWTAEGVTLKGEALREWWKGTNQEAVIIDLAKDADGDMLKDWVSETFGYSDATYM
jgi:hypothetical protein